MATKLESDLSVRDGRLVEREPATNEPFSSEELAQLEALAAMRDEDIDTDDIPEIPAENLRWACRPGERKSGEQIMMICLDADVVDWLRRTDPAEGYPAAINRALREYIAGR